MTKYEIMFIVKSTLDEETIKKTSEDLQKLINKKPSKVIEFKEMGRKKLAYEIENFRDGFFVTTELSLPAEKVAEFRRQLKLNDNVLRTMFLESSKVSA